MNRIVEPELLDDLPANDPRAIQSRRDLRRINAVMGNARIILRYLEKSISLNDATIAEIGAGDGNISKQIAAHAPRTNFLLIDRRPVSSEIIQADVFDWIRRAPQVDAIIANLFLHHFHDEQLRELLANIAASCRCFVACEPRRNRFAHWFSRRVNLIGCNEVTQNDAAISVRAGFRARELTALWPSHANCRLTERPAGLFSHFFGAIRP